MKHLHKCGMLHRDLKPANVLVGRDMTVSLIDFGISRVRDSKRPMTMNVGTTSINFSSFHLSLPFLSLLNIYFILFL